MEIKGKENNSAITLIALIITIIILLVLAGITIAALTGDNGVLRRASEASEKTEIANEQEKVRLSAMGAITKNNGEKIIRTNLNEELTNNIGKEGIDYTLSESETAPFVVTYSNSGRSYLIDENGILRFSDGTAVNTLYGNTTNPTMDIHYPTINTMEGKSESIGARNLKYTDYNYNKSKVEDIDMQDILFNGNYWLASRCITSNYYVAQYRVGYIDSNQFDNAYLYTGNNSTDFEYSYSDYAVRPIVILKSNVIDTSSSTEYNGKTMWNLK